RDIKAARGIECSGRAKKPKRANAVQRRVPINLAVVGCCAGNYFWGTRSSKFIVCAKRIGIWRSNGLRRSKLSWHHRRHDRRYDWRYDWRGAWILLGRNLSLLNMRLIIQND